MRKTTIAAIAAAAVAAGAAATGALADSDGWACPAWSEQDRASADLALSQIDAVMASYGFAYQEPELSAEQELAFEADLAALEARFEERMPEAAYWGTPSPQEAAEMARLYAEADAEYDSLLAGYGFVVRTPELSERQAQSLEAELAPLYERLDELGAQCWDGVDEGVYEQIDAVMASYGFVYEEPELSEQQRAQLDSELARLWSETERLASDLGYYGYSAPSPEQAGQLARLYAEADAEHDRILRGYGFVIEEPELSEQRMGQMASELEPLYGLLDPQRRR